MPHWTKYDPEVQAQRQQLRAYGLGRLGMPTDFLSTPTSYKVQALRELAHRLELADVLHEVRMELARMTDRMEAAECALDIARHGAEGKA